ncbi:DUF6332 family protein [Streptomyces montanisoli]|uniref:Uncharacterized protein n=1 Tax=Streptomyces montanisoli TaxID=2798581 RepID=A0A940MIY3_9ACTN|nr:DUF6332 family protein [Streptomyces montanisoli]MBP0460557.1 hypothetical protein [Streptomyces montanisoli]
MDLSRDSRGEKDAMTVEIVFAFVTGLLLAAAVFAVVWVPALLLGVAEPVRKTMLVGGALAGAAAGIWRLVSVLVRFDARRREG